MRFDFKYNDNTGCIEKTGHYSQCTEREATREEALLWGRVQDLEQILDTKCPPDIHELLTKIASTDEEASRVILNPEDFARIREFARHRITISVDPKLNQNKLYGYMPIMNDGCSSCVWISVGRDVALGDVRVVL